MRKSEITRKTTETDISLKLELDGAGVYDIDTGCGFLNHMLELFTRHGGFDITLKCTGDIQVDDHHTVEDVGIVLGMAFSEALGDKKGIMRYGQTVLPMDEALILTAIDISGRSFLGYDLSIPSQKVGTFDTELVEEFWNAFVRNFPCSLHILQMKGMNSHHIIEGAFKSAARSIKAAVSIDAAAPDTVPSTKGVL